MPRTIKSLLLGMLIISSLPSFANEMSKEEYETVLNQYLMLYDEGNRDNEFLILSDRLKNYYLNKGDLDNYYNCRMNEALYQTSQGKAFKAINTANDMLGDMKERGYTKFHIVDQTLSTIFESRGNYTMAEFYLQKALETIDAEDTRSLVNSRLRMAALLKFWKPQEALQYTDQIAEFCQQYPPLYQTFLVQNALIRFAQSDKRGFEQYYQSYLKNHRQNRNLGDYGMETLNSIKLFYEGKNDEALEKVCSNNADLDTIAKLDIGILMQQQSSNFEKAFELSQQRIRLVDSLNSDMLFDNLNQLHADTNLAKAQQNELKFHEQVLLVLLLLTLCIVILLLVWSYRRGKIRHQLQQKNEQLSAALQMATESERMKTEFVRSVSHEIRTPLNAISGFNEILNSDDIQLTDEERKDHVQRIKDNVGMITKIVDEMISISEKNATSDYARTEIVICNQFLSKHLYSYRPKVSKDVELLYTSNVINRFAIKTNADALQKILDSLIQNAVKFTNKGSIELNCCHTDRQIAISLTDTGTGIPAEMQETIFQQFVKADSFQQGIGLGLTLSKKMAQRLGGDLILDSTYTDGARFVLTLPIES